MLRTNVFYLPPFHAKPKQGICLLTVYFPCMHNVYVFDLICYMYCSCSHAVRVRCALIGVSSCHAVCGGGVYRVCPVLPGVALICSDWCGPGEQCSCSMPCRSTTRSNPVPFSQRFGLKFSNPIIIRAQSSKLFIDTQRGRTFFYFLQSPYLKIELK